MHDVNWWLMALSFVLGLLFTFAFTIRRVKREVPETAAFAGRGPGPGAGGAAATAGAAGAGGVAAAKFAGRERGSESQTTRMRAAGAEPYGVGSARAAADGSGPSGWTVKGNEDSMLYHTPDSPYYAETVADVIWFRDKESAERAGFSHWHKGRPRGRGTEFAEVVEPGRMAWVRPGAPLTVAGRWGGR